MQPLLEKGAGGEIWPGVLEALQLSQAMPFHPCSPHSAWIRSTHPLLLQGEGFTSETPSHPLPRPADGHSDPPPQIRRNRISWRKCKPQKM